MGWLLDQARAIRDQDASLADPLGWFDRQQWPIWSLQADITREVEKDGSRVLVPSCNGAGKTHIAALIAAWFALRYRRENARVVIIGPSWDQLRDGTHAIIGGLDLGAGVAPLRERHLTVDARRAIVWRSPPKGWSASRPRKLLQGLHASRMLVILEEGNEIPPPLWQEATAAIVSGGISHILGIFNPTSTGTPAHQASESGAWTVMPISAFDTPNFTGEPVATILSETLPTQAWAEEQKALLTPGDYRARVLGEWPERSEYTLINPEWIETAMHRAPETNGDGNWWAIDPGSGGDPTTVYRHGGDHCEKVPIGKYAHSDDREAVGRYLAERAIREGIEKAVVDTFGVGADHAVTMAAFRDSESKAVTIRSINSGDRQKLRGREKRQYANPRAMWGWQLRDRLEKGTITLPLDRELRRQIVELRQSPRSDGLLELEAKKE